MTPTPPGARLGKKPRPASQEPTDKEVIVLTKKQTEAIVFLLCQCEELMCSIEQINSAKDVILQAKSAIESALSAAAEEKPCEECGGIGHLYPNAPRGKTVDACPSCNGTGRKP